MTSSLSSAQLRALLSIATGRKSRRPEVADRKVIRVLHVLHELQSSGAEVMLLGSLAAMRDAGVVADVLATGDRVGPLEHRFLSGGAEVHHLPFEGTPRFLERLVAISRLYDVVHVHTERASFYICAALRRGGIPVVRTVHSAFQFDGWLRMRRGWQRRQLAKLGVRFVAVSDDVALNERRRFGNEVAVIRNSADSRFYTAGRGRVYRSHVRTFVTVGNCAFAKNHELMIEAIANVSARGHDVMYLHLGSESEAVFDERDLAERAATGRVRFLGPGDPLPHLMDADVFVMPSRQEGLGVAVLEALASGIPTVLTDVPGLRAFRAIPGIWWAHPSTPHLADVLENVVSTTAQERSERARMAASRVAEEYPAERGREQLLDMYRTLTHTHSRLPGAPTCA